MFLLNLNILDKIKKGFSFVGVERGVSSPTTSRQRPRIPSEVRETLCEVRPWEHVGLMVGLGHVT